MRTAVDPAASLFLAVVSLFPLLQTAAAIKIDLKNRAVLLHLGKAGGGTILERLSSLGITNVRRCHPRPCPRYADYFDAALIALRDPADRFYSNFHWKATLVCRDLPSFLNGTEASSETTAPGGGSGAGAGTVTDLDVETRRPSRTAHRNPSRLCKKNSRWKNIIYGRYARNASALAERLCDAAPASLAGSDGGGGAPPWGNNASSAAADLSMVEGMAAVRDLISLGHAGRTVVSWVGPRWQTNGAAERLVPIILEPGYDLLAQTDAAAEWAVGAVRGWKEADATNLSAHANSSALVTASTSTGALHSHQSYDLSSSGGSGHPEPLSDVGACCVARYFEEDYHVLQELAVRSCRGRLAEDCRGALWSIVRRRRAYLDRSRSCQDIVQLKNGRKFLLSPRSTDAGKSFKLLSEETYFALILSAVLLMAGMIWCKRRKCRRCCKS